MSISTYSDLKTAVASWLNKTNLTSVIPDFITLAEVDIRRDLRIPSMEALASGTLTGETLAHPTRFIEARRLTVGDYVYEYVTPDDYARESIAESGLHVFTSIGMNLYILGGVSGDSYTLLYSAGLAALSGDSDTNWVLTNAPDIYLAAACRHGCTYLKDAEGEARWGAKYAGGVARENNVTRNVKYPGQLTVRAG